MRHPRGDMSRAVGLLADEVVDERMSDVGRVPPGMPPDGGDGGGRPFGEPQRQPVIDAARMGMLVFLAAETMLFAGFVTAFLVFRLGAPVWPPPFQPRLPLGITGVNTAVLLLSGYTMWRAIRAGRRGDPGGLAGGLALTALLGAGFLGLQGYEWGRLLAFGLTAASGVYGGMFYVLIGAHAVHVVGALVWLCVLVVRAVAGRATGPDAALGSVFSIYWYFVVALWPVLYVLVYVA